MAFSTVAAAGQVHIALIVKNAQPSELFQLFLVRHGSPPPSHALVDVPLWDLPSVPVALLPRGGRSLRQDDDQRLMKAVSNVKFNFECLGLKGFDVQAAVAQVIFVFLFHRHVCLFVSFATRVFSSSFLNAVFEGIAD